MNTNLRRQLARCSFVLLLLALTSTSDAQAAASDDSVYTWSTPNLVVTYGLMGFSNSGAVRAGVNSSAFIDKSGKIRMIFQGGTPAETKWSVTSADSGSTWVVDSGFRWPTTIESSLGHISVTTAPEGGFRAYVRNEKGISSVYSSDGQTWTAESGIRIAASTFGLSKLDGGSVVKLPDGRYRMFIGDESSYFSRCGSDKSINVKIYSATSSDQLTWTADPGHRIGPDLGTRCNLHPHAFVDSNGKVGIIFHVNNDIEKSYSEWQSSCHYALSEDGLTFSSVRRIPVLLKKTSGGTESMADDCDVLALPDKRLLLFFSLFGPVPEGNQIAMSVGSLVSSQVGTTTSTVAVTRTSTTVAATKKITCVKGKLTKIVSGTAPKCPTGYKKKM
jgi:hypothetical protein